MAVAALVSGTQSAGDGGSLGMMGGCFPLLMVLTSERVTVEADLRRQSLRGLMWSSLCLGSMGARARMRCVLVADARVLTRWP